jgi:surfeit locus 1 family protein
MSSAARRSLLLVLLLMAAICVRLGFWQLSRLRERQAANRVALAARAAPPISLDRADQSDLADLAERRVVATGRYDSEHAIVLRGLPLDGVPGVHLVTPLLLLGQETAVLVDRGFVPAPDAVTVNPDSLREPGRVRVVGLAAPIPSGGGKPLEHRGRTTWRRLDLMALRERLPYPILPLYLRQLPDSSLPPFPRRVPPPPLDEGPHLSYAVQWFLFGLMAVLFGVLVVNRQATGRSEQGEVSSKK